MYTMLHEECSSKHCKVRCFTLFVMTVYPDGVCTVDQVIVDVNGTTATFSFCGVGSDIVSFLCKLDGVILPTCK